MATVRQAAPTSKAQTIDIGQFIDALRIGPLHYKVLFWSFLIMLLDGYDILVAALAGPYLVREWGVQPSAMGALLSASLVGFFFGTLIFGYVGDRWGRRIGIIAACVEFGVFTLAAAKASSLNELIWLRALAGVGIGGVIPNTIALSAEFAPKRVRATLVILMFTGNTFGGALVGPIANWLVPDYGWQILFVIGGVIPLVLAACLYFALPESIKFLAVAGRHDEAARLARELQPDLGPDARLAAPQAAAREPFMLVQLFEGRYAVVTPLLWLLFAINLMTFYFINSWMPTLITTAGAPPTRGALATSLFQLGGTIGGVVISIFVNRYGLRAVALLFVVAIPVVASIGYLATSEVTLFLVAAAAGFCLLGVQFGLNAGSGMIYPTAFRANGVGWAFGIGRVGAVAGPYIGGFLIAAALPLPQIYMIVAIPLVVAAIACFVLTQAFDTSASD
jgi:AAHS family 4-hydroxybenzoate transporter-like MFS transporter